MTEIYTYQIDFTNECPLRCKHCYALKKYSKITDEVLDKAIDYISNKINLGNHKSPDIILSGGEVGLYNPNKVLYTINKIRNNCPNYKPKFIYQTSLIYNLTKEHLDLFNKIDVIGVSYDYKIRYSNYDQEILFFNNLDIVKKYNENILFIMVLHKQLLEDFTPERLMSFLMATGCHTFELERLCIPMTDNKHYKEILPKNEDTREFLTKCYFLYKKIQKIYPMTIGTFECLEASFNNRWYYEHSRSCCENYITINPSGNINTCFMEQNNPIGNIMDESFDIDSYNKIISEEKKLNDECKNCKYLKWCKGDCHKHEFDETGCQTPYKIYEYLQLKTQTI